jgi:hypothetical protein
MDAHSYLYLRTLSLFCFAAPLQELTAVSRSIEQAVESVRANARWLESCKAGVAVWLAEN